MRLLTILCRMAYRHCKTCQPENYIHGIPKNACRLPLPRLFTQKRIAPVIVVVAAADADAASLATLLALLAMPDI